MRHFYSDNSSSVHPRVMQALDLANDDHAVSYGHDPITEKASQLIQKIFSPGEQQNKPEVYFVFNGTGANVIALTSLCPPYGMVLVSDQAHVFVDECGSPVRHGGFSVFPVDSHQGKIRPEALRSILSREYDEHKSRPSVLSITQPTESGTLYSMEELAELGRIAQRFDLRVHMDGARLGIAVAAGLPVDSMMQSANVDILSFGGTKNGAMMAEAILVFRPGVLSDMDRIRKQTTQLASKMRYLSAQFIALLESGLWIENSRRAMEMAHYLKDTLSFCCGLKIVYPVEANAVFAILDQKIIETLHKEIPFAIWDQPTGLARFMCSFDTQKEDIDHLAKRINELSGGSNEQDCSQI